MIDSDFDPLYQMHERLDALKPTERFYHSITRKCHFSPASG